MSQNPSDEVWYATRAECHRLYRDVQKYQNVPLLAGSSAVKAYDDAMHAWLDASQRLFDLPRPANVVPA